MEFTSLDAIWSETAVEDCPDVMALCRAAFFHGAAAALFAVTAAPPDEIAARVKELAAEIATTLPAPPAPKVH